MFPCALMRCGTAAQQGAGAAQIKKTRRGKRGGRNQRERASLDGRPSLDGRASLDGRPRCVAQIPNPTPCSFIVCDCPILLCCARLDVVGGPFS